MFFLLMKSQIMKVKRMQLMNSHQKHKTDVVAKFIYLEKKCRSSNRSNVEIIYLCNKLNPKLKPKAFRKRMY